jgi:hypothetical protein
MFEVELIPGHAFGKIVLQSELELSANAIAEGAL